jgi:hypothetical protein
MKSSSGTIPPIELARRQSFFHLVREKLHLLLGDTSFAIENDEQLPSPPSLNSAL